MSQNLSIRFPDLVERDAASRQQLDERYANLSKSKKRGHMTNEEAEDFRRLTAVLERLAKSKDEVADPLFVALRDSFNSRDGLFNKQLDNHVNGVMRGTDLNFADVTKVSLVFGFLAADNAAPPRLVHQPRQPYHGAQTKRAVSRASGPRYELFADLNDPLYEDFSQRLYAAVGEANAARPLAEIVLSRLEEEGDPDGLGKIGGQVTSTEFALVVRRLRKKGIRNTDKPLQLRRAINEALDELQLVGVAQPLSKQGIELPLFNSESLMAFDIQAENVRLCAVPICVTMFDELKVFQVVEKLVEMAQDGTLNTTRGDAGEMLYHYWKDTAVRISETERRKFVAQSIGVPGGDIRGPVNRDCNDLWSRFVSSVSELVRQQTADNLLRNNLPSGVRQQQVRKAARDLARNLSAHTFGMSLYLALDLQEQVNTIVKLLSHEEIRSLFGAKDMWQVIDQIATLELGGARDTSRYATLASCGAIITAWLADNVKKYNSATSLPVIDLVSVLSSDPPTAGENAVKHPTDYDLVNACELWATDMAYSDEKVEELSQPRESPASTSRPVPIPSVARELLEQSDLASLGVGSGLGTGNGLGLGLARR
jgi:hypothetical protein